MVTTLVPAPAGNSETAPRHGCARFQRVDLSAATPILTEAAVMMKRPRSFISTLLIVICLASVGSTLDATRHVAMAGGIPRVMDPRAGDPTEPSDGIGQDGN